MVPNTQLALAQNQELLLASTEQVELVEQLLAIGTALSNSHSLEKLLELILSKSREITCSDAGSLYLIDRNDGIAKLLFKAAQNDSIPQVTFREFAMPITHNSLSGYVALTGESLNLPDAYNLPPEVPYQLDTNFDRDFSYKTRSVLVLPMQNQQGEVIGVLQLINRKVKPDTVVNPENVKHVTQSYSDWEARIVRSLASMAAISIERNHLQESIENLFEGFVTASIQLIEKRDPTTYGHSERVAALSVGLSIEVNSVTSGPLESVYFSARQLQEIRYAALLHDFGEVGVPEALLHRLKKLSPEQLEIVRQRFAVAGRTLELDTAQAKFQYLQNLSQQQRSFAPTRKELVEFDTYLLEAMENLDRLWELLLKINEPESSITREFQALSDEELALWTELSQYQYRDIDGKLKYLVTTQEMAQLMVPRGNLTPEERLAIEAHVTYSYHFLKQIPWTNDLKNIPSIVLSHHEKLDGTGYPQRLKQEQIPIASQILALADIYDALTAGDRPYKDKVSAESAVKILKTAASKNKLNPHLVDLFEQRQVYTVLEQGSV
ncbi:HD domain-containing phosphohydrolase [Microseira sp. BLCC-F43]|jgi:HD-GYP domain-containing protein (c-di-GMP phosphodiesterase class II)|uniref:HD domain-containing phosphohydrolase n=1 Tax=Microseira sp. BLCC-F43 TaxID=3153602 RepID=UPI0035B7888B